MDVRFAGMEDIPDLIRVRFDFFDADPELAVTAEQKDMMTQQMQGYFKERLNRDFFAALAETDGRIAAIAFLIIHYKPANYRCHTGIAGEIVSVFTYTEYRFKGYATAVLKRLIDKAREENLSYIELSASPSGRPVYEKLGFTGKPESSYVDRVLPLL